MKQITSGWPTIRELLHLMDTSAFLGIHPVDISQTSRSLFMRMAERIREGRPVSPDFDVAVKRHQLLDAIQKAPDTGIPQIL
jgi:predicted dehydrogenase